MTALTGPGAPCCDGVGIRFTGMPGFAEGPPEQDVASWHLVHLIRRLPHLTDAEREEIEELVPRSREQFADEEIDRILAGEDPAP